MKNVIEKQRVPILDENLPVSTMLFSNAVGLLQQLIHTPSFSGEEAAAADLVQHYFAGYGIKTKRKGNNVWCYNKYYDPIKPTILLNSHLDTVKPNDGYKKDPFCPEVSGGRLFGLGSNDAGGCLVSLIAAFLNFYSYQGLPFNLCLAATAEEENSGLDGIRSVLPYLGHIEFAIVGEPTLLQMAIAERGNLVLDCVATGNAGHAAREEGDNAIYKCLKDIEWFKSYRFEGQLKGISPVKMTVTEIRAGIQHNIVPGKCAFTVDVRNDDGFSHQQILEVIRANTTATISVRPDALSASSVSPDHPVVKTGVAIGCKTYSSPTSSDQAWLSVPSVKLGPGDSARSHTADEYIFLEEIKRGINLYIKLLDALPLMLINNPTKYRNEIKYINN